MSKAAEKREPQALPHTHPCPDCGKLIDCQGIGTECTASIAARLKKYPCDGARRRPIKAIEGTCIHCGQTELDPDSLEPLADGLPSNCCRDCWAEFQEKRGEAINDLQAKWREDIVAEEIEGERRERERRMSKKEKAKAESGKHSLRLVK